MAGYIGAKVGTVTANAADIKGDITSTDTSPDLTLKNTTQEDSDGGRESTITFKGEQSGGEESTLAEIRASHDGTADDQKGDLIFKTNDGSDGASPTERLRIDSGGKVGIGGSPTTRNVELIDTNPTLAILSDSASGTGQLLFGDPDDDNVGRIYYGHTDNEMRFYGNASERMRIDSSGKVGIGLTDPDSYFADNLVVSAPADGGVTIASTANTNNAYLMFADGTTGSQAYRGYIGYSHGSPENMQVVSYGYTRFYTSADGSTASERMRIDSSGNVLMGGTNVNIRSSNDDEGLVYRQGLSLDISAHTDTVLNVNRMSGNGTAAEFRRGGTTVGSVSVTTSSTSFNTSSDYRLKENVTDISDGITRVKQLAPKRFNFITDADTTVDGFLAHEAQAVVPEAVHGTKDEVDDDGNAVMQGIDQAKLVPLLTAALQEAIAKIETLETENTAIKARLDALEAE